MINDDLKVELIEIGIKMSQTIQEFAEEIEQAGNDKPVDLINLLQEWEGVYKKTGDSWQSQLANKDSCCIKGIL